MILICRILIRCHINP